MTDFADLRTNKRAALLAELAPTLWLDRERAARVSPGAPISNPRAVAESREIREAVLREGTDATDETRLAVQSCAAHANRSE